MTSQAIHKIKQGDRKYHVLTLSHKKIRLYEGDRRGLKRVYLSNLPEDMKESLNIDEYPQSRELHQIAPASMGKGSAAYHSQYEVSRTDKDMLLRFFRLVNKRLDALLHDKKTPLVLAGVDYLMPIYKKANTFRYLIPKNIKGNVDRVGLGEIHEQAWRIISNIPKWHRDNLTEYLRLTSNR